MTRERAIECNKNLRMYMKLSDKNQPCKFLEENYIALDMAIKALEQEPKTGHWIGMWTEKQIHTKDGIVSESVKCSECDEWLTASDEYDCYGRYCPNCGARMVEPQESEEI